MNLDFLKKKKVDLLKKLSLRDKKHLANLQSNSGLYFQIGLAATLFLFFCIFQLKLERNIVAYTPKPIIETEELPIYIEDYIVEEDIIKKPLITNPIQKVNAAIDPIIVDNDTPMPPIIDTPVADNVITPDTQVSDIVVTDLPPEIDTVPISLVSDYPEFPGCEKLLSKNQKFECFQQKISAHLQRNFNTDIASDYDLKGVQKVFISFTVNHKGKVVNVMARAPNVILQKEAIRSIKSLPLMKPAKQGFKKVNVTYSLPLVFKVN